MKPLTTALVCLFFVGLAHAQEESCYIRGDMNCDEVVDCDDVDPFVLALSDPDAWELQYPDCPIENGDVNEDGSFDFGDINPFHDLLEKRPIKGDMNCDGCINDDDVDPFVLALSDPCAWKQANPGCPIENGDINDDGDVDFGDINPFIDLLGTNEIKGDLNCDRCIDDDDVNPFVLALTDPEEYSVQYPDCPIENADVNGDGSIDFGDINPFEELLESGCD